MEKNEWKVVNFGAGKAFDAFGRATSFWTGVVAYRWDCSQQKFHISLMQILGTGTIITQYGYNLSSCDSVNTLIDIFHELEAHYKKVYGE